MLRNQTQYNTRDNFCDNQIVVCHIYVKYCVEAPFWLREATNFLLKQLKQNKSDFMCKKFLAILYEIIRYSG